MRLSLLHSSAVSLIFAAGFAYVVSAFVTEKPFPHATAQQARGQIMKKADRNVYGSDNVVIDEVFYVSLQFPVWDGGVERVEVRVTEQFFDAVAEEETLVIYYDPDDANRVSFEGKEEPMSRYTWTLIFAICSLPPFFFVFELFVRRRRNLPISSGK